MKVNSKNSTFFQLAKISSREVNVRHVVYKVDNYRNSCNNFIKDVPMVA